MKKLSISFFGAPDFAARVLEKVILELSDKVTVSSVFTQPDKKVGRKQILTPTPVKLMAQKYNIPVFDDLQATNYELRTTDLALLYAYGKLIPTEILKIPRWGFWNIHPSLLPKYRGTSPIVYSLLMGDKTTGVSLMEMDERMDHGPILAQESYEIKEEDTRIDLEKKLSDIGYKLFKQSVQLLLDGKLEKRKQDHTKATYTRLLTKQDGYIPFPIVQKILQGETFTKDEFPHIIVDYTNKYLPLVTSHYSLATYYSLFRALTPWPGVWTLLRLKASEGQAPVEKRLKITGMTLLPCVRNNVSTVPLQPTITRVQLEGKKEVGWDTFKSAYLS